MKLKTQMKKTIGKRATRRIYRAAPWVGAAIAAGVGSVMTRNGTLRTVVEKGRAMAQPGHVEDAND